MSIRSLLTPHAPAAHRGRLAPWLVFGALAATSIASPLVAQTPEARCTVSVLNQVAQVQPDGSWLLPNVPSNLGRVRARMTCLQDGVTASGTSEFFSIATNRMNAIPPVPLGAAATTPARIAVTAPNVLLSGVGQSVQLAVRATYADGTSRDVTAAEAGTTYSTTNPRIATVDASGRVTATGSGRALVSALHEAVLAAVAIDVVAAGDTDGDGLADDLELSNGLDPNDPVDALEDLDGDGLTNRQELLDFGTGIRNPDSDGDGLLDGDEVARYGTNPVLFDTDGDGLSDGLEVRTGSDPLDPASYNLALALASMTVAPTSFVLNVNPLFGEASRQLAVTGHLIDGTTLDLTSRARGTNYASSDLGICGFGVEDGRVFAVVDGSCTVTASNSGFAASASGRVRTFNPTALSYLDLAAGYPNNVDVAGDYAYVASGDAGLAVVDVHDRNAPTLAATLDTPGNANDVRVVGALAYVADGGGGLRIVDLSNPLSPVARGALAPPGVDFRDIALRNGVAYVADRNGRFWRIDVSDPDVPAVLGTLPLADAGGQPVGPRGVAIAEDGSFAVVATEAGSGGGETPLARVAAAAGGITVIDLSDPGNPRVAGSVATGNAHDVAIRGRAAYVADVLSGFTVVSLADLAAPAVVASAPVENGGLLEDVELARGLAFGADIFFFNGVPILSVSGAAPPEPRAILDFSAYGDENGSGIAVDQSFVYLTAGFDLFNEGVTGGGRLYLGRYSEQTDEGGVAPTVAITSPASGTTVVEGADLEITADATDDVAVAAVDFLADGVTVATDSMPPFQANLTVPSGAATLALGARAVDYGANQAFAAEVTLQIAPDPKTTVIGRVLDSADQPVPDAQVAAFGRSGSVAADGTFVISEVPTIRGPIVVTATGTVEGEVVTATSGAFDPVPGGTTDIGTLVIQTSGCATGRLTFDPFVSSLKVVFLCRSGPVDFPVDLIRVLGPVPELQATGTAPGEEFIGQITPGADGRFCADLRPNVVYYLRREDVLCDDGVIRRCSATIERFRLDVRDRCEDGAPACEDLGTVVFDCDFFGGS